MSADQPNPMTAPIAHHRASDRNSSAKCAATAGATEHADTLARPLRRLLHLDLGEFDLLPHQRGQIGRHLRDWLPNERSPAVGQPPAGWGSGCSSSEHITPGSRPVMPGPPDGTGEGAPGRPGPAEGRGGPAVKTGGGRTAANRHCRARWIRWVCPTGGRTCQRTRWWRSHWPCVRPVRPRVRRPGQHPGAGGDCQVPAVPTPSERADLVHHAARFPVLGSGSGSGREPCTVIAEAVDDRVEDFVADLVQFAHAYARCAQDDHRLFVEAFRAGGFALVNPTRS